MNTFLSSLWAGFECTYALRADGQRLDLLASSRHDECCAADYALLEPLGIRTVREGFAWHQIDQGHGRYNFKRFEPMLQCAAEQGVQQVWDLNHFDYPAYLNAWSEQFVSAFARYAQAVVQCLRRYFKDTLYLVPINEPSYWAWRGATIGDWAPFGRGEQASFAFKQQLVRASLAAMQAIWTVDQKVRFIHVDPFVTRLPHPELATPVVDDYVTAFNERYRFECWDMLSGQLCPELGGDQRYLEYIGFNYYPNNQEWVLPDLTVETIPLNHPARMQLSDLLKIVDDRYDQPIIITETGACANQRLEWWQRTLTEVEAAMAQPGVLNGLCIYPTVDQHSWTDGTLTHAGLWDFHPEDTSCARIPVQPVLQHIYSHRHNPYNQFNTFL